MRQTPRRAPRRDANEREIIDALEAIGASVVQGGPLDLIVGYRGSNYIMEVKDGSKPPSKRKLTSSEQEFIDGWEGRADVVESIDEAFAVLGVRA